MPFQLRVLLLVFFLQKGLVFAQTDTVETARTLGYAKNYSEAIALLTNYEKNNPKEINSVRLHAQLLYWMKSYSEAFDLCEAYLKNNPDQNYLKLDYGRMLFELQRWAKSKELLSEYLVQDTTNIEVKSMLGTIAYWQGQPAIAKKYLKAVIKEYPSNEWALRYLREIADAEAPYIKLDGGYFSDSQPLQTINSGLEFGYYRSNLFAPQLKLCNQNFDSSGTHANSYSVELANKFFFSGIKTEINLSGGIVQAIAKNSPDWIGKVGITKKIEKHFSFALSAERLNYQSTLSNFSKAIMHTDYAASLSYSKEKRWSAKTAYTLQHYADSNYIQQYYAWILAPSIRFSIFEFYLGYNFNFTNSQKNHYSLYTAPKDAIVEYDSTGKIPAIYAPYFTPQNQIIHSVLANLVVNPSKKIALSLSVNYGVYAIADSPYLYFDFNQNKQLTFVRDYYDQKFKPFEISAKLNYKINTTLFLAVNYTYKEAFYFTSSHFNLSLKYTFRND